MFARLSALVTRYWLVVLAAWLVIPVLLKLVAPSWDEICRDGDFAYLPARMTSSRAKSSSRRPFPIWPPRARWSWWWPGQGQAAPRGLRGGRPAGREFAPEGRRLRRSPPSEPRRADRGPQAGQPASGPNGQAVLVVLQFSTEFMAVDNIPFMRRSTRRSSLRKEAGFPAGLQLGVTGSAAVGTDMLFRPARASTTPK